MKFTARRLSKKLLPRAEAAFAKQAQIGKHRLNEEEVSIGLSTLRASLTLEKTISWTALSAENEFAGYLVQTFSPVFGKHWLMSFLVTNPDLNLPWDYSKNGMDAMWQRALIFGRHYDCHNVLWSMPTAWTKTTRRTQLNSEVWSKYEIHAFGEVKAGELPKDVFDLAVFGTTPKPYDVTLRCAWPITKPGLDLLELQRERCRIAMLESLPRTEA